MKFELVTSQGDTSFSERIISENYVLKVFAIGKREVVESFGLFADPDRLDAGNTLVILPSVYKLELQCFKLRQEAGDRDSRTVTLQYVLFHFNSNYRRL